MHATETPLASATRRGAVLAGPAAVLSLLLLFAALAVSGSEVAELARSPLGALSSGVALLSVGLLLLGLVHLARTVPGLQDRAGRWAVLAAGVGTLLLAGAAWSQLVVLPALAVEAPALANEGTGLVTFGYVVSFLATGLGWLLVALRLRGSELLSSGQVGVMIAGSVLMVAPLPTRWFLLGIAVSLVARTRAAAVPAAVPAAATA